MPGELLGLAGMPGELLGVAGMPGELLGVAGCHRRPMLCSAALPCMDPAWTLHGPCLEPAWTLPGPAWTLHGPCMDPAWTLHGPCMDPAWTLTWTLHGPCMDPAWTLHGPALHGPALCCSFAVTCDMSWCAHSCMVCAMCRYAICDMCPQLHDVPAASRCVLCACM